MFKVFLLHGHKSNKGGVVNFYNNITPAFDKSKFLVKQIRNGRIEKYNFFNYLPFRLIDIAFNYLIFCCLIIIDKPTLVHLNPSIDKKSIYRDYIYLSLTKLLSKSSKIVTHFHGWSSDELKVKNRMNRILEEFLIKSNHIIVLAETFKAELISKNIRESKISVIPTAVKSVLYDNGGFKDISNENQPFQVLFLSRIVEDKGIFVLADAISQILSSSSKGSFRFVFAGDGKDRYRLENRIKELGLNDISFTGYVRDKEKIDLFLNSDIFIFPSFYGEGCPVAVLEAMASGLPLITTRVGALEEIVEENVNGLLIDKRNSEQVVNAIEFLAKNKNLRENMGKANKGKVQSEFDVKIVSKRIEDVYLNLARQSK